MDFQSAVRLTHYTYIIYVIIVYKCMLCLDYRLFCCHFVFKREKKSTNFQKLNDSNIPMIKLFLLSSLDLMTISPLLYGNEKKKQ